MAIPGTPPGAILEGARKRSTLTASSTPPMVSSSQSCARPFAIIPIARVIDDLYSACGVTFPCNLQLPVYVSSARRFGGARAWRRRAIVAQHRHVSALTWGERRGLEMGSGVSCDRPSLDRETEYAIRYRPHAIGGMLHPRFTSSGSSYHCTRSPMPSRAFHL